MVVWSKNLVLGETIKKKHRKLIHAISRGKPVGGVYLLTCPSNPVNLMDLIPAKTLKFPYYKRHELHIMGLAGDKEEAEQLAADMILKVYTETGSFNVCEYFR